MWDVGRSLSVQATFTTWAAHQQHIAQKKFDDTELSKFEPRFESSIRLGSVTVGYQPNNGKIKFFFSSFDPHIMCYIVTRALKILWCCTADKAGIQKTSPWGRLVNIDGGQVKDIQGPTMSSQATTEYVDTQALMMRIFRWPHILSLSFKGNFPFYEHPVDITMDTNIIQSLQN